MQANVSARQGAFFEYFLTRCFMQADPAWDNNVLAQTFRACLKCSARIRSKITRCHAGGLHRVLVDTGAVPTTFDSFRAVPATMFFRAELRHTQFAFPITSWSASKSAGAQMQTVTFPSYFEFDGIPRLVCGKTAPGLAEKPNAISTKMSQAGSSEIEKERVSGRVNEAAIVFARATSLYREGQLERAIALFDEVLAVSNDEDPQQDVACVAAHISLYKIHRSLGHEREANEHFSKAVSLGANAKRLQES